MANTKGQPTRVKGPRSRTGCLTCRARRIKCDERRPICTTCRKARLRCKHPDIIHAFVPGSDAGVDGGSLRAVQDESAQHGPTWSTILPESSLLMQQLEKDAAGSPRSASLEAYGGPSSFGSSRPSLDQVLLHATEKFNAGTTEDMGASTRTTQSQPLSINSESAYLLRTYSREIGTWMDVFDCSSSYRQGLLSLVSSCPLLLHSTCALAARQLSLISSAPTWTPVAEKYYGESLGLLRSSLNDPAMDSEHSMVATILLSSYELLAFPGRNYHRHFQGAKSLVEALGACDSSRPLTRASFWIYARHEIGEAMNIESSTMQNPKLWPKANLNFPAAESIGEDVYCNDVLRICGEVLCCVFGLEQKREGKKWAKEWSGLRLELDEWLCACPKPLTSAEYLDNGSRRFWFPAPAVACALCFYHASQIFLLLHRPKAPGPAISLPHDPEARIQFHAEQLVDIALSDHPDGVLVPMVQPLYHAARWVNDSARRESAIVLLEQLQARTGFHTESKVQILKTMRDSSFPHHEHVT